MNPVLLGATLLVSQTAFAQVQSPGIKSWKTLTNDNGFEFKYPNCWEIRPDNPDELDQPVTVARDIAVEDSKSCAARPLLNPPHKNGLGFSGGWVQTSKDESLKNIEQRERSAENNIQRKEWLFFRRFKVGSDEAVTEVEFHKDVKFNWIRWKTELFCPTQRISVGGPTIKDPDPSYFAKFKAGDMAMPEPEKTIFESIRCVEPRAK